MKLKVDLNKNPFTKVSLLTFLHRVCHTSEIQDAMTDVSLTKVKYSKMVIPLMMKMGWNPGGSC